MRALLSQLEREGWYRGQVVRAVEVPPRPAVYAPPPRASGGRAGLARRSGPSALSASSGGHGRHPRGEDVILATGPSSGKTLAMALPILARLAEDPEGTALLLYP